MILFLLFVVFPIGNLCAAEVHEAEVLAAPTLNPGSSSTNTFRLCYFSLNHKKEFEVMKALAPKMNKQLKDKKIEVIEYLPEKEDTEESFTKMIETHAAAGTKCDGLVVSGHHTGAFGGDRASGDLSIEFLERLACDPKYSDWFSNVKALWLQGCRTMGAKVQATGPSANDHADRVLGVREADNLTQSYGELSQQFSDVMDTDNPLSFRYRRVFARATVFGWTDGAPGEQSASEMSIPFHMAHMARLKNDESPLINNLNTILKSCPNGYSEALLSLLDKNNGDQKSEKKIEDDSILAWLRHGRAVKVPGCKVNPSSFPNPDLQACQASCSETLEKQIIFAQAKVLGCAFKNYKSEADVVKAAKILKSYPELTPFVMSTIGNFLNAPNDLSPVIREKFKQELKTNKKLIEFLKSKLSDPKVGLIRKLDYYSWLKEISPEDSAHFTTALEEEALIILNPKADRKEPTTNLGAEAQRLIEELNNMIQELDDTLNVEKISDVLMALKSQDLLSDKFIERALQSRLKPQISNWLLKNHYEFETRNLKKISEVFPNLSEVDRNDYLLQTLHKLSMSMLNSDKHLVQSKRVDEFFLNPKVPKEKLDEWIVLKEQAQHINTPRIRERLESIVSDKSLSNEKKQGYVSFLFGKSQVLSTHEKSVWAEKLVNAQAIMAGTDRVIGYIENPERHILDALDASKDPDSLNKTAYSIYRLSKWQNYDANKIIESLDKNYKRLKVAESEAKFERLVDPLCSDPTLSFKNLRKFCIPHELAPSDYPEALSQVLMLNQDNAEVEQFEREALEGSLGYWKSSKSPIYPDSLLMAAQKSNHKLAPKIIEKVFDSQNEVVDRRLLNSFWAIEASLTQSWLPHMNKVVDRIKPSEIESSTVTQIANGFDLLTKSKVFNSDDPSYDKDFHEGIISLKNKIYASLDPDKRLRFEVNSREYMLADLDRSIALMKNENVDMSLRRLALETMKNGYLWSVKPLLLGYEKVLDLMEQFDQNYLINKRDGLLKYPEDFVASFKNKLVKENGVPKEKVQELTLRLLKIFPQTAETKRIFKAEYKVSDFDGSYRDEYLRLMGLEGRSLFDTETTERLFPAFVQ